MGFRKSPISDETGQMIIEELMGIKTALGSKGSSGSIPVNPVDTTGLNIWIETDDGDSGEMSIS